MSNIIEQIMHLCNLYNFNILFSYLKMLRNKSKMFAVYFKI